MDSGLDLQELCLRLKGLGVDSPQTEALVLLETVSGQSRTRWLAKDAGLNPLQKLKLKRLLQKRSKQPLAYVLKSKEFYALQFKG